MDKFNCSLSKQSINERFTDKSVAFLKMVISHSLADKLKTIDNNTFLKHFTALKIQDSTSFQLPECMKDTYAGGGGSASSSLARIQFEFDIKEMNMTTLELTSGKYQDASFAKDHINSINSGELIIRDLGYLNADILRAISENNAFYLNRLRSNQVVYLMNKSGQYHALDFKKLQNDMDKKKLKFKELYVYLKRGEQYLGTRLIVEPIPKEVYAIRIRKAAKEAKKKRRGLTDKYKERARFNLFITNVERTVLSAESVRLLYSIRWQIELIFKSWKSTFGIAKIKSMKKERIESQLYARLLLIIVSWRLFSKVNNFIKKEMKLDIPVILSFYKFCKLIVYRLEAFLLALIFKGLWLHRFLDSLISAIRSKGHTIERKKNTNSSINVFGSIIQTANNQSLIRKRTA